MNDKLKNLWRYIFPAMGGLFVTYLYNVVDGIFVGHGVGSAASGAVDTGVPFITFAVAVAAMFPKGGATVAAIRMGRGDREGANHSFMTAVALTLLLTAAGMMFCEQIIGISGGRTLSGAMRDMAEDLFYYCGFSIPILMSTCLSVFVRNDGSPVLSFAGGQRNCPDEESGGAGQGVRRVAGYFKQSLLQSHLRQGIQERRFLLLDTILDSSHDLFAGLIPSGFLKDRLSDIDHLLSFLFGILLDKTDLLTESLTKFFQLPFSINTKLSNIVLSLDSEAFQLAIACSRA